MNGDESGNGTDAEQGFTFPGRFTISVVGDAGAELEARVPELLERTGLPAYPETARHRHSREGSYVSIKIDFECPSRAKYEQAHAALRHEPGVRYTL